MKQHTALRPAGTVIVTNEDGKVIHEADTMQCPHCSGHVEINPGSKRRISFCTRCMKPTCGRPECEACVPIEKFLELVEAGKAPLILIAQR